MHDGLVGNRDSDLLSYAATEQFQLDPSVIDIFNKGVHSVLVPFSVENTEVHFHVGDMIPLAQHAASLKSCEDVATVLRSFRLLIKTCVDCELPLKNLELDSDLVFFDASLDLLRFVYLPFEGIMPNASEVRSFFIDAFASAHAVNAPAADMLRDYRACLEESPGFNPFAFVRALESFDPAKYSMSSRASVGDSMNNKDMATTKLQPQIASQPEAHASLKRSHKKTQEQSGYSGKIAEKGAHARVDPGTTVLGELTFDYSSIPDETEVLNQFEVQEDKLAREEYAVATLPKADEVESSSKLESKPEEKQKTPAEQSAEQPAEQQVEQQTEQQAEQGQTLETSQISLEKLKRKPKEPTRKYWLCHRASDERVCVSGERFVVGKSKYSDYQVRHTTTVSRSHVIISCDDEGCWIEDDGSRNGTYLDNRRLEPHVKERLKDGMVIRMSDEEFTFSEQLSE